LSYRITRREFIDGIARTVVASAALPSLGRAAPSASGPYPPGAVGLHGSRPQDLADAHAVRDGLRYEMGRYPIEETVDVVVVGAGLGGLTAAHCIRRERRHARVLILDNHDDFGGHARRNEFDVDGRRLIGYGGSESIQSPHSKWPSHALHILSDIGISVERLAAAMDRELYPGLGLSSGVLFQRDAFGVDRLVTGDPQRSLPTDVPAERHNGRRIVDFVADFPVSAEQKERLIDLYGSRRDVLAGKTRAQKLELLAHTSYLDYLRAYWGLDETSLKIFRGRTCDLFAFPADAISAKDCADCEYPGFGALDLGPADEYAYEREPYIYHFPDGNAGIARSFVRELIPGVAPGRTMDDIVMAPFEYGRLDVNGNDVRLRLSTTVVQLRNVGKDAVDVLYTSGGTVRRIRARHAIYAGYESMLPYICPDLGTAQRDAVAACVKAPLVYVNVALRNWHAWVRSGVHNINNPAGFYPIFKLDYPVSLGDYQCARRPDEPILVHFVYIPRVPEPLSDRRLMLRAARGQLYSMEYGEFERAVREELTCALGPGGFVADRDIAAITVNRWGHGYAYDSNSLFDTPQDHAMQQRGRQPIGRISIGGSDAAWSAYAHDAIEQGYRAAHYALDHA
jgi:spermidine dehydrogenase